MIYALLLAAGTSSRMGQPKQLLLWHGQPLVRHVAAQALASNIAGLVVVVGAAAPAVRSALGDLAGQLRIVENSDYAAGQASSLRAGLAALPAEARAALMLLVDQPLVTPALLNRLVATYAATDAPVVIPRYAGQRGNPVLIARPLFGELQTLTGDTGARAVFQRHTAQIVWLDVDDPAVVTDADTPEAFERMQRQSG